MGRLTPRGLSRTGKRGESWLDSHQWCPNDPYRLWESEVNIANKWVRELELPFVRSILNKALGIATIHDCIVVNNIYIILYLHDSKNHNSN